MAFGTSTLSETWRIKYMSDTLAVALRKSMVSRAIFNVDESGSYYIANPYRNQPVASIAAIAGSYAVSDKTTTDDTLTVTEQVTYGEHYYEYEQSLTRPDVWATAVDELSYAVAVRADAYVLNEVLANAGGSFNTPTGGFTTAANWTTILATLISKVAGYSQAFSSLFLVVENSDLVGILNSQMQTGFNFSDSALRNGLIGNQANVEIYIVRDSTFIDATTTTASGTKTWTNSGKRLGGVKNVATYACPGGVHVDEKKVTLKTGRELSVWMNIGAKLWATKTNLIVAITIV